MDEVSLMIQQLELPTNDRMERYILNKSVMDAIEVKAGLPILIDLELGIVKDDRVHYTFTPYIIAVKDDISSSSKS